MKFLQASLIGAGLMVCALTSSASADIIYSNFQPGQTYNESNGWGIIGADAFAGIPYGTVAFSFAPSSDYGLSQIDVGLAHVLGTNEANVVLYGSSGGNPGAAISSWTVSGQPSAGGSNDIIASVTGITGITLTAGTTYFVGLTPFDSTTYDFWNVSSFNTPGYAYQFTASGGGGALTNLAGAFDVIGTPTTSVPEPLTLSLFGAGLAGAFAARRKARKG